MSDYFIFDDIDTRNYEGILVYFDEVDTTPKRVGEFIEIPNRNGSLFLDGGRYEDVTHTYDIIALSKENGRNLINALASKVGHYRLEDSFNTGEYYSAAIDAEFEPTVTMERDKITFKVMFTRKPQRWLTSGETATTVANNGTLTNPTLFESSPMLEVTGYGDIGINGETVTVQNSQLGETDVTASISDATVTLNTTNLNTGDSIYNKEVGLPSVRVDIHSSSSLVVSRRDSSTNGSVTISRRNANLTMLSIRPSGVSFVKGTNKTIQTKIPLTAIVGGVEYNDVEIRVTTTYTASSDTVTMSVTEVNMPSSVYVYDYYNWARFYGDSTKTLLPTPMYIDLDIGEAYGTINGEIISFNNIVSMPAELPKLKSGTNTFTKSNTVTQLKVVPRWWKV